MYIEQYRKLDPEFTERFERFAFDEVVNEQGQQLDDDTRYKAILAALIGCQGLDAYKEMLPAALKSGTTPEAVKEIVYQSADYMGMGRMWQFLKATNDIFEELGVKESEKSRAATTFDDRLEKGAELQAQIFGSQMKEAWKNGHINRWLAANCFGDYYTRKGLTLKEREMITFCFLMAQGGCEPQLTSHAMGNMNLGNDKDFLTKVVSQCLPYIGYPRSLNAVTCINNADAKLKQS